MILLQTKTEKTPKGNVLFISGPIDEDAALAKIQVDKSAPLTIDLSDIISINSCGIREWVKWMKSMTEIKGIRLVRCPSVVVEQASQIHKFLPTGGSIESFYVPYFCEHCEHVFSVLCETQKVLSVKNYIAEEHACEKCFKPAELDIIPGQYLRFLTLKP